jgi:hypothetical protein
VDAIARLSDLRTKLGHAEGHDPFGLERIDFRTSEQGVHVYYFGSSTGDHYSELLNVLASESVSRQLMSLQLDCPDAGANGTWNWDLEPLASHLPIEREHVVDVTSRRRMTRLTVHQKRTRHQGRLQSPFRLVLEQH